jgi:DNA-directed RNA polymerase specialized sigma24 family protein
MIIITKTDTLEATLTIKSERRTCIDDDGLPQEAAGAPADGPVAATETPPGTDEQADEGATEDLESARRLWTTAEKERLKDLQRLGHSQVAIARMMGRSKKAIKSQLKRLGLPTSRRYPAQSKKRGSNAKP